MVNDFNSIINSNAETEQPLFNKLFSLLPTSVLERIIENIEELNEYVLHYNTNENEASKLINETPTGITSVDQNTTSSSIRSNSNDNYPEISLENNAIIKKPVLSKTQELNCKTSNTEKPEQSEKSVGLIDKFIKNKSLERRQPLHIEQSSNCKYMDDRDETPKKNFDKQLNGFTKGRIVNNNKNHLAVSANLKTRKNVVNINNIIKRKFEVKEIIKKNEKFQLKHMYVFECYCCHKILPSKNKLLSHISTHNDIKCRDCDTRFSQYSDVIKHNQNIHENNKEIHYCFKCMKTFSNQNKLYAHRDQVHNTIINEIL